MSLQCGKEKRNTVSQPLNKIVESMASAIKQGRNFRLRLESNRSQPTLEKVFREDLSEITFIQRSNGIKG